MAKTKLKVKNWLKYEKDDLVKRARSYPRLRILLLTTAIFGFAVSFLSLWPKTHSPRMNNYDTIAFNLAQRYNSPFLLAFFTLVTWLGTAGVIGFLFIVLAVILSLKQRKRAAFTALMTLLGSAALMSFFKVFFGRFRPGECLGFYFDCYSFPSGHTTFAVYFYGLLNYLILRFLPISLKQFLAVTFLIMLLIISIALSRLFLGYHFFSDIIAGGFLGASWLLLAILLIDILY